jgi:peptidoglycan-associated lipoprotein
MIGCHGRKMRSLEEQEAEEAARRDRERARLEQQVKPPERPITPIEVPEEKVIDLESVRFDYDKYNLTDAATEILSKNAAILMDNPSIGVQIEGHCDERGTDEYNLALGEKRAIAARDFLVRYGIAKPRISIISYGEERPLDPGHDEDAWAKNRRAGFVIR